MTDLPLITPCASFDEWKRLRARFFAKTMPEPNSGCLLWLGAARPPRKGLSGPGYGLVKFNGGHISAHRLAWLLDGRELPDDMQALHSCDNTICVEVRHLFLGTHIDNMHDRERKGRGAKSKLGLPFGVAKNGAHFAAQVGHSGKRIYLGTFKTADEAHRVARAFKDSQEAA